MKKWDTDTRAHLAKPQKRSFFNHGSSWCTKFLSSDIPSPPHQGTKSLFKWHMRFFDCRTSSFWDPCCACARSFATPALAILQLLCFLKKAKYFQDWNETSCIAMFLKSGVSLLVPKSILINVGTICSLRIHPCSSSWLSLRVLELSPPKPAPHWFDHVSTRVNMSDWRSTRDILPMAFFTSSAMASILFKSDEPLRPERELPKKTSCETDGNSDGFRSPTRSYKYSGWVLKCSKVR